MPFTRRQFIGSLAAALGLAATPGLARVSQPVVQPPKTSPVVMKTPYAEDLLIDSFFPTLVKNEGKCLYFYRCTSNKVSVGYGTNVQDNPAALTGVSIQHKGKTLTPAQVKTFLAGMKGLTAAQLKKYTITAPDAKKMALSDMRSAIHRLSQRLTDDKTKKSIFFNLPLCMQALCLDIAYNIGTDKFLSTYPKLQAALKRKDYAAAVRESTVYTNKKKKKTNKARERRKQRLLRVMTIAQNNSAKPSHEVCTLIASDYQARVSILARPLGRTTDIESEQWLALGELAHIRIERQRIAQANRPMPKPEPKGKTSTMLKTASKPLSKPVTHKNQAYVASVPRTKPTRGPEM